MDLDKTIEESLDGLWNNSQYGGVNELPRKDYQPYNPSGGYTFPYQSGMSPSSPVNPDPENTPSIPWPLQTVTDDLTDSFIYLVAAIKKMERCERENISISDKQRENLNKLIKISKSALVRIRNVGANVVKIVNLAGNLPPQSPSQQQ
jgi:hypothetical protein